MRSVLPICLALLALGGCGGGDKPDPSSTASLDCAHPLVWDGLTYEPGLDLPATVGLGPTLGEGVMLGCSDGKGAVVPDETVTVSRVEGIDPAAAVAVHFSEADAQPMAFLVPGYLLATAGHPLHEAAGEGFGSTARDGDFTCGDALETRARALATPAPWESLTVEADDPAVEALLVEPGTQRLVGLDGQTSVTGLERNGVPYVGKGDEFTLVLRACDGNEGEPGIAGLRLLVADSLAGD